MDDKNFFSTLLYTICNFFVQLLSFQLARVEFEQVLRVQQRESNCPGIGFGRCLEGFLKHEGDDKDLVEK